MTLIKNKMNGVSPKKIGKNTFIVKQIPRLADTRAKRAFAGSVKKNVGKRIEHYYSSLFIFFLYLSAGSTHNAYVVCTFVEVALS